MIKFVTGFIVIVFTFSLHSCKNKVTIEYVKSGNELVLRNGVVIRLANTANSLNNKQYLELNCLFKEIIVTDKNYNEISIEGENNIAVYVFLNDGTCVNDLLEKDRFAGSEVDDDLVNSDNPEVEDIPLQAQNDSNNIKIIPIFGNERWSKVDVKGTKDISECYEFVQSVFRKHKIKNLPHIPVRVVNRHEMTKLAGSLSVVGLAYTQEWGDGTLVHEIKIVENLPRLDFTQVLAHEILHTWIKQNNVSISKTEEEGLCNYASYLVLLEVDNEYSRRLINDMMSNPDPIYGGGFRKVKSEIDKIQLNRYIQQLLN